MTPEQQSQVDHPAVLIGQIQTSCDEWRALAGFARNARIAAVLPGLSRVDAAIVAARLDEYCGIVGGAVPTDVSDAVPVGDLPTAPWYATTPAMVGGVAAVVALGVGVAVYRARKT